MLPGLKAAKDRENNIVASNAVSPVQAFDTLADGKLVWAFDIWESIMIDWLIGRNIQIKSSWSLYPYGKKLRLEGLGQVVGHPVHKIGRCRIFNVFSISLT